MAVEDGAIIATLLGLYQQSDVKLKERLSMAETLKLYESLQKARTTTLHLGNLSNQHLYHLEDGAEQEERDAILKAAQWQERPEGESEQFIWIDVRYQKAIVARDAVADAKEKWDKVTQSLFNQDSFIEL